MKLQIFKHEEFKSLRVTVNEKGETLFCLTDVCKALGIGNASELKKGWKVVTSIQSRLPPKARTSMASLFEQPR